MESQFFRVFTQDAARGNPAAVLFADGVDESSMQDIARAHDIVMTVFVLPSRSADVRFRFFTPKTEMDFCGHGILAGAYAYAARRRDNAFSVETNARRVSLRVDEGSPVQFKTEGEVSVREVPSDRAEVAGFLGLRPGEIDERAPFCVASIGSPKLLVPVPSLETLTALKPDLKAIAAWSAEHKVNGVYVYTLAAAKPEAAAHARSFNPLFNPCEDAATGVAAGALAAVLVRERGAAATCMIEQGPVLGEQNQIWVSVEPDGVSVGGFVTPDGAGR